ncbi:MAG: hypothetical protein RLZZ214_1580 [Verrucomicrobiota bacterium]
MPRFLLPALGAIALAISSSNCNPTEPRPAHFHPQSARSEPWPLATTGAPRTRSSPGGRPDPRYPPAAGIPELRGVAGEVAKTSGRKINWQVVPGPNPGPLVSIRGSLENCTIFVHPVASRKVPPNTWAFLFGHEFSHLIEDQGDPSNTTPAKELRADIAGARYAIAAGYRLDAFLGWALIQPDRPSGTHGSLRGRVQAIAARFGISSSTVQAQARRYSLPHDTR